MHVDLAMTLTCLLFYAMAMNGDGDGDALQPMSVLWSTTPSALRCMSPLSVNRGQSHRRNQTFPWPQRGPIFFAHKAEHGSY